MRLIKRLWTWVRDPNFRENWGLFYPPESWHIQVSTVLAKYVYWIFWPVAKYFTSKKYLFAINNISYSIGHAYIELDYTLRMQELGHIPKDKIIIFIWPKSPVANGFRNIKQQEKFKIILNGGFHILVYPLLLRYRYLSFDAGLSDLDHSENINGNYKLTNAQAFNKYINYFRCIALTSNFYPLVSLHQAKAPRELKKLFNGKPYVLIQIKDKGVNASFGPTNPDSYLPVIQEEIAKGRVVIFAGREKMPALFEQAGVVNYANSNLATAENDYYLIRDAVAVLSSGSGFSVLADVLGVPLLITNVWNFLWVGSKKTLALPSLISIDGRELTFIEQYKFALDSGQVFDRNPTNYRLVCRDNTACEIQKAWHELLAGQDNSITDPDSPCCLQQQARQMLLGTPIAYASSKIASSFLSAHKSRLLI
jgi:putative glycosyltransferase (TIGR04372 family)